MDIKYPIEIEYMKCVLQINEFSGPRPQVRSSSWVGSIKGRDNNKDVKMNLGHPFLIYGLCKQAGVSLEDNEAWIYPIKAIMVKKVKPGVPRPKEVYDSGNEPSDEDEVRAYQS